MSSTTPDATNAHTAALPALSALLAEHGLGTVRVRAAGPIHEIAVIEAPASAAPRLAALAETIRGLGFRYVAIDLASVRS